MSLLKIIGIVFEYILKVIFAFPALFVFLIYGAVYDLIDDITYARDKRALSNEEEIQKRKTDRDRDRWLHYLDYWKNYWTKRLVN